MGNLLLGLVLPLALFALLAGCAISQEWRNEVEATADPIVKGRLLYENSCNRCHALYMPRSYTKADWRFYVRKYAPRARISQEEAGLVVGYLRKNARNATRE